MEPVKQTPLFHSANMTTTTNRHEQSLPWWSSTSVSTYVFPSWDHTVKRRRAPSGPPLSIARGWRSPQLLFQYFCPSFHLFQVFHQIVDVKIAGTIQQIKKQKQPQMRTCLQSHNNGVAARDSLLFQPLLSQCSGQWKVSKSFRCRTWELVQHISVGAAQLLPFGAAHISVLMSIFY